MSATVTGFPSVYETCGPAIYGHAALAVTGTAQKRGEGALLIAQSMSPVVRPSAPFGQMFP